MKNRPVFVIGHKNPDTDSICAAICYANLKSKLTGEHYEARRCGHLNEETQFVLNRFGVQSPIYTKDVRTQVCDMEIRDLHAENDEISLKRAWERMKDENVVTLCITKDGKLEGLVTTNDIMETCMDVHDASILSEAGTSYGNIVDTLDGAMLVGDKSEKFTSGKVLIATASPEIMEEVIDPGDIVICGNRYETQLVAIENEASCIVVCIESKVTNTIQKLAEERGCRIITTPYDTFTVARLINESAPVGSVMKKDQLVTFHMNDFIEDIQQTMAQVRHRYFPVLDEKENFVGMISRRNLLGAKKKQIILVDHNEKSQTVDGIDNAEILEIIDHHRLGSSIETANPVFFRNQPLGSSCTIIYSMYKEAGIAVDKITASLMLSAIISDTLMYRSPTCTEIDKQAGKELAQIAEIDVEEFAREMFRAGSNLGSKTPKQIVHQDFKKFTVEDKNIGIGQINSMSAEELAEIKERVLPELEDIMKSDGLDMIFFMMTNIIAESSIIAFAGNKAENIIDTGFHVEAGSEHTALLKGVVSRKKQLLPTIVEALQQ
ncbi:putative manganese-dependent inorganic diphosphatase [Butyrivibrio sp. WCD3002]|uniref:putative manganese-dependent inorganic diphosphatase n=1 Tax=Butyrivibrio sp. WCD3002 TaxID=1280676 RepID=UPI000423BA15|nr:putative manganese-dependent inorganic diphosphatase [Butyrivibrio sp. WCD3002]